MNPFNNYYKIKIGSCIRIRPVRINGEWFFTPGKCNSYLTDYSPYHKDNTTRLANRFYKAQIQERYKDGFLVYIPELDISTWVHRESVDAETIAINYNDYWAKLNEC